MPFGQGGEGGRHTDDGGRGGQMVGEGKPERREEGVDGEEKPRQQEARIDQQL